MHGLDTAMPQIAQSEVLLDPSTKGVISALTHPLFQELRKLQQRLLPLVTERKSQLIQEFSFWPSSPPKQLGGIYEMRVYDLVRIIIFLVARRAIMLMDNTTETRHTARMGKRVVSGQSSYV